MSLKLYYEAPEVIADDGGDVGIASQDLAKVADRECAPADGAGTPSLGLGAWVWAAIGAGAILMGAAILVLR